MLNIMSVENKGWLKLHRKVKDHYLYREKRVFSKFEAWIDILLSVNHTDTKVLLGAELIEVKAGSFITSEIKLMERWGWSKNKVRSFLFLLESDKMLVRVSDKKKTTLTVVKYGDYQILQTTDEPQMDHKPTMNEPQMDTDKNEKNDNNEKNEKKNIDERKLKFAETLKPFVDVYGRDMIKDFYEYWTEPNQSNTKFKKEMEKTWSLDRRLKTWHKNSFGNKNQQPQQKQPTIKNPSFQEYKPDY